MGIFHMLSVDFKFTDVKSYISTFSIERMPEDNLGIFLLANCNKNRLLKATKWDYSAIFSVSLKQYVKPIHFSVRITKFGLQMIIS